MDNDQVVCGCNGVTVQNIKDAINGGAKSFEEVQEITELGNACGSCIDDAKELVEELLQK
ncbi:(2Fe-2S)-binding protein [Clostridium sp.]|uniref:(2Fe-2S)-binding protein n=1 Tax=Clostridium sp. TaxID=1506 RepID=UPI00284EBD01|nr:(2Fe-2S)-binding protein [Clostridium sp.]MDR3596711.1 (2Fe-2S)-binding protein [Clostridium sp.]